MMLVWLSCRRTIWQTPDSVDVMSETQTVVITGASGLVGSSLTTRLESDGREVVRAVRQPVKAPAAELHWDPERGEIDAERIAQADVVVHLAGENIAGHRWTESFKQKIHYSRTKGTLLVSEAVAAGEQKPRTFVCASAIGYYGDRGDELLTEESASGDDFLAKVCRQWEAACDPARAAGVRVVNLRFGVILSTEGGALKQMLPPFQVGAGGVLGSGRQFMSWITLEDVVRAIQFAIDSPQLSGPVNVVAPQPVTNREFTKTLGHVLNRPTVLPMPAFAARILFGEMADALLLASARVEPVELRQAGFEFNHSELEPALRSVLGH